MHGPRGRRRRLSTGGDPAALQPSPAAAEDALDEDALHLRLAHEVLPKAAGGGDAVAAAPRRKETR